MLLVVLLKGVLGQGHLCVGVPLFGLGIVVLVVALVIIKFGCGVLLGVVVKPLELGLCLVPLQGLHVVAA